MKFNEFVKIYQKAPLIDSSTFSLYNEKPQSLRRQVREWVKKDYLIPLKRGLYIFSNQWRKIQPSVLFMANFLVLPSYVSLEQALGFYEIIPEKVTVITSVTTKKTKIFRNLVGSFEYRSIKEDLFFGFKKEIDNNQEFFIALPEKALLDFFYLNNHFQGDFSELESLRLQNLEVLNIRLLETYGLKYNRRIRKIAEVLIEFVKKEKGRYRRF
jgi:predicted transcriptional regulator of viral defense system